MNRRRFLGVAATASLAGCLGIAGNEDPSRLDLTVQNDRADPVTAQVTVFDDEGTTYEDESDRIDSGVARAFEMTVGTSGRHEVTVSGEDWGGELAWDAGTCARFDGTVRVTDERVEVAGECVESR
ncbi:hypothetical protein SAMN05216559_3946 [Halomicrobium zhouii]|uniref:Uncharacterized protein n=1 Tax=Halomicrobium zhouii TaxID=767519 RepID=A0A1I6M866_9EURY|nr:hypothetical protein [Halomicrobium zhouii]SFS11798.1 hypothetical protein SAMN05216559_3946 [Halomicrobium zhouii]